MDSKKKADRIEERTTEILQASNAWSAPVRLDLVAEHLNLKTTASALEDNISGVLVVEGKQGAIGYNRAHSVVRQRFTIAHEIGHYVMQVMDVKNTKPSQLFIDKYVAYRSEESSSANDHHEIEANAFAAALLMPKEMILEELKKSDLDLDDEDDLSTLAKKFNVSMSALSYRLINLRIIRFS